MKNTLTQKITFSVGIFISVFSFIIITACNNPASEPVCDCPVPQYLPCSCGLPGCDCVHEPYAYITDPTGVVPEVNIPIYFHESVGNMQEVADNVIAGYREISDDAKGLLQGKINQVWIGGEVVAGGVFQRVVDKDAGFVALNALLNKYNVSDAFEYIFLTELQ